LGLSVYDGRENDAWSLEMTSLRCERQTESERIDDGAFVDGGKKASGQWVESEQAATVDTVTYNLLEPRIKKQILWRIRACT